MSAVTFIPEAVAPWRRGHGLLAFIIGMTLCGANGYVVGSACNNPVAALLAAGLPMWPYGRWIGSLLLEPPLNGDLVESRQ